MSGPDDPQDGNIVIHAVLQAAAGQDGELAVLLLETQRLCRREPGCVAYRMTRDLESADTFHVFEIWDSEAGLRAHGGGRPFRDFLAGLGACGRLVESRRWIGALAPYVVRDATGAAA